MAGTSTRNRFGPNCGCTIFSRTLPLSIDGRSQGSRIRVSRGSRFSRTWQRESSTSLTVALRKLAAVVWLDIPSGMYCCDGERRYRHPAERERESLASLKGVSRKLAAFYGLTSPAAFAVTTLSVGTVTQPSLAGRHFTTREKIIYVSPLLGSRLCVSSCGCASELHRSVRVSQAR